MSVKSISLILFAALFFIACYKPVSPLEQVKRYVAAIDSLDYKTAASMMLEKDKDAVDQQVDHIRAMSPEEKAYRIRQRKELKYSFTEQEVNGDKAVVVAYVQYMGKITPVRFKMKLKEGAWMIDKIVE